MDLRDTGWGIVPSDAVTELARIVEDRRNPRMEFIQQRHRQEWPALWRTIDLLIYATTRGSNAEKKETPLR